MHTPFLTGQRELLLSFRAIDRLSASGPSRAGGDEPEAAGAWKSEKRNKKLELLAGSLFLPFGSSGFPLRCDGEPKKNFL